MISACNSAPIQRNYVTIQRRGHGNRADVTVFYLNMNKVDYLTSVRFSTLPIEQKLEIKRLGPDHPEDFTIRQNRNSTNDNKVRTFNKEWFKKKTWLTGSSPKRRCFASRVCSSEVKPSGQRQDLAT